MKHAIGSLVMICVLSLLTFFLLCYPFLPGRSDTLGSMVSMYIQVLSLPMLLSAIPAFTWTLSAIKRKGADGGTMHIKVAKRYVWTVLSICTIVTLVLTLATGRLLPGILAIACQCLIMLALWNWKPMQVPEPCHGWLLPLALTLLPAAAICFQVFAGDSLARRSRKMVIENARPLIDGIERFHERFGHYPFTLNANWKDYHPGIIGTEKFHYSYDGSTYTLYFEQPRFFYDHFGVREIVAYSPTDTHLVVSHTGWFIDLGPDAVRQTPGWFASQSAGLNHWRIFWFD